MEITRINEAEWIEKITTRMVGQHRAYIYAWEQYPNNNGTIIIHQGEKYYPLNVIWNRDNSIGYYYNKKNGGLAIFIGESISYKTLKGALNFCKFTKTGSNTKTS